MTHASAVLDDKARASLKLDPHLGAGNFLHYAFEINGGRDVPIIYSDRPAAVKRGASPDAYSISELKKSADRYAAWYLSRGVARFDPVAVYLTDGIQNLIQYVALTSIGALPVLTNAAMDLVTTTQFLQRVGAVGVVSDRDRCAALAERLGTVEVPFVVCVDDIPETKSVALPTWHPYRHDHDDPVMITHSSGTTGVPKPVLLQHGRWFHGIRHLLSLAPPQGAERYLSSLPVSHNAAIAYAMHVVLNGGALMIMSDPHGEAVASAIEQFRPGTVVSFPQTYAEMAEMDLDRYDLGSVSTWINSGDAAHEAHIRRLVGHGYHYRGTQRIVGSQFVDGLGSSELGHSSLRIVHTLATDTYDRCVGIPQTWVDAAVLDEDGKTVPTGVVGRLGIRSPSVTTGYWNDSLTTCRSRLGGYWLTGDLVFQDSFGCFYHVDRVSDVIRTKNGLLYSLQTEELILKRLEHLIDCSVIAMPASDGNSETQVPVVLAVPRAGLQADEGSLLARINGIQTVLGRPLIEKAFIVDRREIPVGVTGKVLKRELRRRFVTGDFDTDRSCMVREASG